MVLKYTLITDGSSDRALMPIIDWLCRENFQRPVEGQWFDPRPFSPPSLSLEERIFKGFELYPCDILFIHRDAEGEDPELRFQEIHEAIKTLAEFEDRISHVCVVPIRMTEAWLLFDEVAIRKAAGNPNGNINLNLPNIRQIETIPDPKSILFDALRTACELPKRRRKRLDVNFRMHRVAEIIGDFSVLRNLTAFDRLEKDIQLLVADNMEA